jgi:hypothetical protein
MGKPIINSQYLFKRQMQQNNEKKFNFKIQNYDILFEIVPTLTLVSRLKQGFAKVWAKSEAQESHFMLLGV